MIDALVAKSTARKRAAAAGSDPGEEPEVAESVRVVSMAGYLSRRIGDAGSTPFGPDYDPLTRFRWR